MGAALPIEEGLPRSSIRMAVPLLLRPHVEPPATLRKLTANTRRLHRRSTCGGRENLIYGNSGPHAQVAPAVRRSLNPPRSGNTERGIVKLPLESMKCPDEPPGGR